MTTRQLDQLRKVFQKYDDDGNGYIERNELWKLLQDAYQPTKEQMQLVLEKFDLNGDGVLDRKEFMQYATHVADPETGEHMFEMSPETQKKLNRLFDEFDKNKSGTIDVKNGELAEMLRKILPLNAALIRRTMTMFDKDSDDKISFDEFCQAIQTIGGNFGKMWANVEVVDPNYPKPKAGSSPRKQQPKTPRTETSTSVAKTGSDRNLETRDRNTSKESANGDTSGRERNSSKEGKGDQSARERKVSKDESKPVASSGTLSKSNSKDNLKPDSKNGTLTKKDIADAKNGTLTKSNSKDNVNAATPTTDSKNGTLTKSSSKDNVNATTSGTKTLKEVGKTGSKEDAPAGNKGTLKDAGKNGSKDNLTSGDNAHKDGHKTLKESGKSSSKEDAKPADAAQASGTTKNGTMKKSSSKDTITPDGSGKASKDSAKHANGDSTKGSVLANEASSLSPTKPSDQKISKDAAEDKKPLAQDTPTPTGDVAERTTCRSCGTEKGACLVM